MGVTWHARPCGRAMRRDVTCAIFIYIVSIWFIVHISLPIIGNTLTLIFRSHYMPDHFL